jgi:membrane protein implicated in regulation of membrane protease activity
VRRVLRQRGGDGDPGPLLWLLALVGMAMPWSAAMLGVAGSWHLARNHAGGWWMLGGAAAALLTDTLIDVLVARCTVGTSDQPDLNRRAAQLVGRLLVVAEPIEGGRGKVRAGDTVWPAEGPDAPAGAKVAVTGANGTSLQVVPART